MRLRRIVLMGFKTFARRSEVCFEPGVTGVVGPNGSGKSNLVDAIRWALGETNARELRGTRMDEVIYAGGDGRGRMGVAEVELVIDNEEGRLPVDDAEVAIGRRVVRGGGIEYRINGERARLRDVERLLGATGLTQSGYAVVGQADIDAIIEATPRQRRALVEQAAGVRPLRIACEDALRRLEYVDAAVLRLLDRLDEAEPRLDQLALEAEAALEQRQLSGRLGELRGSLAREEWRAARAAARQARRRLDAAERRLEAAGEAEAAFTQRLETMRSRLDAARQQQGTAADRLEAARVGAERAGGEARRWADRLATAVLHRAGARSEQAATLAELAAAETMTVELAGSDLGVRERSEGLERAMTDLGLIVEDSAAELAVFQKQLALAEKEHARAVETVIAAQASTRQLAAQLQFFDEAAQAVEAELTVARQRAAELTVVAEATAAAELRALQTASAAAELAAAAAGRADALRGELRDAEGAAMRALEVTGRSLARSASLQGQVEGALGGAGVVTAAAGELGAVRLLDSLTVRHRADGAAIEAALEAHLGAWVVDDIERAAKLLAGSSIREEVLAAGPATAVDDVRPLSSGVRRALDAVDVSPRAAAAVAHCLAETWLVADMATAREVLGQAGGRAVLPNGTLVTAAGLRAGGRGGDTMELVAEAQLARLEAEAAKAAEAARLAEVGRLESALTIAASEAEQAAAATAAARAEHADVAAAATAARAAAAAEATRVAGLEGDRRRRVEEGAAVAGRAGAARAEAADADERSRRLRADVERARQRAVEQQTRHNSIDAELRGLELELLEVRQLAGEMERRRIDADRRRHGAAARASVAEARVATAETDALVAIVRGRSAASEAAAAAGAVDDAFARLEVTRQPLTDSESQVHALEQERAEVMIAVARAEDEVAATAAEVASTEGRVAELADAVRGEVDDEASELDAGAAERAEREIARLERRIAAMGPVNGLAPEQHAALLERVSGLRDHRSDLSLAATEVRNLARRLSGEAGRRFDAVFGAVGVHFGSLFAELFPGGRATLRLEDPAEPVEGEALTPEERDQRRGIEILAQPPGKKPQPLAHLSGGERALTSMAVIFALQQVNPSPFYVFDEVDAPLDDTNVLRFTRLLGRLAQSQQFIVITHNHVTMAAADALYGVTIDREGVSSVLSVRFGAENVPVGDLVGVVQPPLRRAVS